MVNILAKGFDAVTSPDLAEAKSLGYSFAGRYIAPPGKIYDRKRLTVSERESLHAGGFGILLIFESWDTRPLDGAKAGTDDAHAAMDELARLSAPDDTTVIFACDTNTTADRVRPYFDGVSSVFPNLGGYGGRKVTAPLVADGTIRFAMQACAWSLPSTVRQGSRGADVTLLQRLLNVTQDDVFGPGTDAAVREFQRANSLAIDGIVGPMTWDRLGGGIDPSSHIYQRPTRTTGLAGSFDEDILLKPVPMWTPPPVVDPAPTPRPVPVSLPVSSSEVDVAALPTLRQGATGQGVRNLQGLLNAHAAKLVIDGDFGPATDAAVRNFQNSAHIDVDGVVGAHTWGALLGV